MNAELIIGTERNIYKFDLARTKRGPNQDIVEVEIPDLQMILPDDDSNITVKLAIHDHQRKKRIYKRYGTGVKCRLAKHKDRNLVKIFRDKRVFKLM